MNVKRLSKFWQRHTAKHKHVDLGRYSKRLRDIHGDSCGKNKYNFLTLNLNVMIYNCNRNYLDFRFIRFYLYWINYFLYGNSQICSQNPKRSTYFTQPVWTLFLFKSIKSIWTRSQGSQGCQKIRFFFHK